jgi:SNF2 family DNA or RNA helicase
LATVDYLRRSPQGWELIYFTISTQPKDSHIAALAFLYQVMAVCGTRPASAWVMHLNNQYTRQGEPEPQQLFAFADCTVKMLNLLEQTESRSQELGAETSDSEPTQGIDIYCLDPEECGAVPHCWQDIPPHSVFDVAGLAKKKMFSYYKEGIVTFEDLLAHNVKLNDAQRRQVEAEVRELPAFVDTRALREFLETLTWPLYYLDFETYQSVLPEFDGIRPYQQILFQYSLHIQTRDDREFLAEAGKDQRRALAESLCADIPMGECVLVYNMTFEKGRIKELAETFPDLATHLTDINSNLRDLMVPFKKQAYYARELRGKYSIKQVLPALCGEDDPELDYRALEGIHNGNEAMSVFPRLAKMSEAEAEPWRRQLLAYCHLDTLAMVKITDQLFRLAELAPPGTASTDIQPPADAGIDAQPPAAHPAETSGISESVPKITQEADNAMELIDNQNRTLLSDLLGSIKPGSKIAIAASCFSIYAYQELKKQLEGVEELRFIFTSPTFVTDKAQKEKREFYIPRLDRERSLYGTEFEVKLRNELTQKAIAKECADWIRRKAVFKSNTTPENMMGFLHVDEQSYMPLTGFTTVDLGCERGNNVYSIVQKTGLPFSQTYLSLFDNLWRDKQRLAVVTEEVIENISTAYNENAPEFIYFVALYHIFSEFLADISEDVLPNEATGFKESKIWSLLYNFQRDAALAIINKLEQYNGCILADSVGLGKTYTALAVIKYYENRNKNVLVLCPKKLAYNWNTFKDNYVNNPVAADRLRYDVLYHTDLNRNRGQSNGLDLARLNWSNYDVVVIDESHNFRSGGQEEEDGRQNRYSHLMNRVIRKGVKTKVLMLSATPVNNRFGDLKNQLALAYEGDPELIDSRLKTKRPLQEIFKRAQTAYNYWSRQEASLRTSANLQSMLDYEFFELLDSVTIARSRKHIETYYDTTDIGSFPQRLPPLSLRPQLTSRVGSITYNEIFAELNKLTLSVYKPSHYILPSRMAKYETIFRDNEVNAGFTQAAREAGISRLTAINLMKRLESSLPAFRLTLARILGKIEQTIALIDSSAEKIDAAKLSGVEECDEDDQNSDYFIFGDKVQIDLADLDYKSWRDSLAADGEVFRRLLRAVEVITPEYDSKLQELFRLLRDKVEHPLNAGNKKVLIFTAFTDTATYLYEQVSVYAKQNFALETALVTGTIDGRSTAADLPRDLNAVLTCFSPLSKDKHLLLPDNPVEIDILIATDCISEGQNLQDCDYLINYDIHWNPVRIIQRFGRIDRIGSRNACIQLVNFWPDISLDEYINLKARVETRMKIVDMAATADDNILSQEEKYDLEYRREQLQRLQEEVVDIEEMQNGISIMDLGLNEFRLDLVEYAKNHPELEKTPCGMHAVTSGVKGAPPGVIYILKDLSSGSGASHPANRLQPFYMVYIAESGEVVCDHLSPKKLLDILRMLSKGKKLPIPELYRAFNRETKDGHSMEIFSELLGIAIGSVIDVQAASELDSLFTAGGTTALQATFSGMDDFELICFMVVR